MASRLTCCTSRSVAFWAAVFFVVWGGLELVVLDAPALEPYRPALALAAAGTACLAQFARYRTLHCAITGPAFLLLAAAVALGISGTWSVSPGVVWPVLLVVVGVALLIEHRTVRG